MIETLSYISQATGLVAALTLFYASIAVPWQKQTWKGESPEEVRHRRRQQRLLCWAGIPCTLFAVACQTAITVITYSSP